MYYYLNKTFPNIFYLIIFMLISLTLSLRTIFIASDDISYLQHFGGMLNISTTENILINLLNEPLWVSYTSMMGNIFTPESAFRLTLFISTFIFLFALSRLSNRYTYIVLIFIFSFALSTQMYFNQIRQGFALTIFIFGLDRGHLKSLFFTIIASLIHVSFLFVLLLQVLIIFTRRMKFWEAKILIFFLIIFTIGLFTSFDFTEYFIYFGSREELIGINKNYNMAYYILFIPLFFLPIFTIKKYLVFNSDILFWRFVFIFTMFYFSSILIHSSFGRLQYLNFAFIPILLGKCIPTKTPVITSILWLSFVIILNINDVLSGVPIDQTWFGRVKLIVFGYI
jgi:hypothetical protein